MTDETTTSSRAPYTSIYHEDLGRAVPTTGIGTVRFSGLVKPATRGGIERGTADIGLSIGEGIDQLWEFAQKNGFNFKQPNHQKLP